MVHSVPSSISMSSKATPSSTSWATRAPYAGYSYASDSTPLRTNPPHWGQLSNRAPKGPLKRWLWEKAQWVEATFALSVIEPWEKLLVCEYACHHTVLSDSLSS